MSYLTNIRIFGFLLIFVFSGLLIYSLLVNLSKRNKFLAAAFNNRHIFRLFTVLLTIIFLLILGNFYVYNGFDYQPDIFRKGSRSSNYVALTFDDGPSPEYTPLILDILKEKNVEATFFMVGKHVEKYPEVAKQVAEDGHEIGNHTYDHLNIPTLKFNDLTKQILLTNRVIHHVTDKKVSYLRPPRGMYDARYRRLAHLLGQEIVLWTISGQDWRSSTSARAIVKRIVTKAKGGEIILLHDSGALIKDEGGNHRALLIALPEIIDGLRAKGLEIVPLKTLLEEAQGEDISHLELNLIE